MRDFNLFVSLFVCFENNMEGKANRSQNKVRCQKGEYIIIRLLLDNLGNELLGQHWSFLSRYIISSYCFYFAPDYLKGHDKKKNQPPLSGPLKCPQNSTHHKSHKLSAAVKIMPVLESEANHTHGSGKCEVPLISYTWD